MTIPASLRLSDEPCVRVNEHEVHEALTRDPAGYLDHLEAALIRIATEPVRVELPPKKIFDDASGGGDFRVMPCIVDNVKTVKVIGTNRRQWTVKQITVGKLLVLDEVENFVTHIFDACLLSSARTAAVAALAIRRLQKVRSRVVIVGAGRIGFYTALYMNAIGGVTDIVFCDRMTDRARAVADDLGRFGVRVFVNDYGSIPETDVLVLATDSAQPVYSRRQFPAELVVSVGADTDAQSELHNDVRVGAQVFVDHEHSARVGDLRRWLRDEWVRPHEVYTLLNAMRDAKPMLGNKIFISTGSALFDNLTVGYYLGDRRVAGQLPAV